MVCQLKENEIYIRGNKCKQVLKCIMQAQIRVRGLLHHWPERTHTLSSASVFMKTDESTLNRNAFEMPKARTLSLPSHGPESKVFSSQQHQGFHFLCPWLTKGFVFLNYLSYLLFSIFALFMLWIDLAALYIFLSAFSQISILLQ